MDNPLKIIHALIDNDEVAKQHQSIDDYRTFLKDHIQVCIDVLNKSKTSDYCNKCGSYNLKPYYNGKKCIDCGAKNSYTSIKKPLSSSSDNINNHGYALYYGLFDKLIKHVQPLKLRTQFYNDLKTLEEKGLLIPPDLSKD